MIILSKKNQTSFEKTNIFSQKTFKMSVQLKIILKENLPPIKKGKLGNFIPNNLKSKIFENLWKLE